MGKSRRRSRKIESSSEEEESSDESETETESSSEEESDYDESYESTEESESESDSSNSDSDSESNGGDYDQLLEVLTRAGFKSSAKKLIAKKIYTINKARSIPSAKLISKYDISPNQAKQVRRLLNDPAALLPPESSDSESDSSEKSEDEDEKVWRILRGIDHGSLIRIFKKHQITTLKKAFKLTEKKLRKLGVVNKDVREKIVKEFMKRKDNLTSTEEEDEVKVAKIMKAIDMKPYIKNLQKGKITDLDSAFSLTSSSLKALGIIAKRDRKKILKAFKEYKKTHAEDDPALTVLKRALSKVGLKKYYTKLKHKGIDSVRKLKKIDHKELRELGIQMYRERREVIEKIQKINDNGTVDVEQNSESDSDFGENNVIHSILQSLYMSRHISDFKRANIRKLPEARKLTQTQLRAMGVSRYLDREKLINAFKDYRPKNKAILDILVQQNLARHSSEFEKLVDIEEARSLTHADLRAMGVSLYGQRDRLIKGFANYKDPSLASSSESEASRRRSKSRRKRKK